MDRPVEELWLKKFQISHFSFHVPSPSLNDWRKQSGLTCSFIVFAALNVAFMYVGITNLDNCPVEKMVPIYLVGE